MATQPERLLAWIAENPGTTSLEITKALGIVTVTKRVSDLREMGYRIDAYRADGVWRYRLEGSTPVKPGAAPAPVRPVCPRCGITLSDLRPTLSPRAMAGKCPTHRTQIVTVAA